MENPKMSEDTTLVLTRTYPYPREKVFRAWTEVEGVKRWFGPEACAVPEAELELRVGGRYRIVLEEPEGRHIVGGEYREISPPERLVFTWKWEHTPEDVPETLVTVEFLDKGASTELVLTHERFPTTEVRDLHNQGWSSSFDCLADALAQ